MQGLWHGRSAWGCRHTCHAVEGLDPPSWLMASDAIMQFSVSVCDFTVDALSLSMLCPMSHLFWFISLHSTEG